MPTPKHSAALSLHDTRCHPSSGRPALGSIVWMTLALATGCVEVRTTTCGDLVCPVGTECSEAHGLCVRSEQVDACVGRAEAETCSYLGATEGRCFDAVCFAVGCGNGVVEPGEACDDGDTFDGDGCSADCRSDETCGNGTIDVEVGERCDDGNRIDGDGCQANCSLPRCGDGALDPDEACDDGNDDAGDGCNPQCSRTSLAGTG